MADQSKAIQELIAENDVLKKRIEELEAGESEHYRLYRDALEGIPSLVCIHRPDNIISYVNKTCFDYFKKRADDLVGAFFLSLIPEADHAYLIENIASLTVESPIHTHEHQIMLPGGEFRWQRWINRALFDDEGNIKAYHSIGEDITERKQAEEQLRQSEEKYRNILTSIQEGYFELDLEGAYTFVNDANCRLLGYTREELIGMNAREHISDEENYNWARQCYRDLYMTGTPVDSLKIMSVKKDGSEGIFETSVTLIKDSQGTPVGFRGVSRDITERKRAEEALLRAQKLESLGTLAGGIAHDFNNLMASVQGYIELAQLDIPSDSVSHERLEAALYSTRQTRELTDRLITFSRGGNPWKKTIDLAEVIKDTVNRTVKGSGVRVAFDMPDNLRPVDADEHQLRQCFFNLALNAVEAMPDGGILAVGAENRIVSPGEVSDLQEGSYLRITFSDDGVGIPPEIQLKLFDPYFTTKGMGAQKGVGLGLPVCYSVFKRHGGAITVTSRPGEGATFVIYLPAVADTTKVSEDTRPAIHGRILIMDDEATVREVERAFLERLGYEVTEVEDGREAIDTYRESRESGKPFDLVLLDLTVRGGIGGKAAMKELLQIDPSVRAIIVSGFTDDIVIENYAAYGFLGALKKPFAGAELKRMVEELLK